MAPEHKDLRFPSTWLLVTLIRGTLSIENSVLNSTENRQMEEAGATLHCASLDFKRLMMGLSDGATLLQEGKLKIDGDAGVLLQLGGLFDQFERRFPIVTPRKPLAD